jgi:hypothetical protein
MKIITQKLKFIIKSTIKSLKTNEIKAIIGRDRLKFNYDEIENYVLTIFEHSLTQKTFKSIYLQKNLKICYETYMSNILLFSKLFKFLFYKINKFLDIKPSKLLNIIDSTLIDEKKSNFITQKDWNINRVTTRIKNKDKVRVCGSKGLVFMNRFNQVYYADLININYSDMNILKDLTQYKSQLKGILLADRGFSNKLVRTRLSMDKNNVFDYGKAYCKLISPYRKSEKKHLTKKEIKLYKRRWKIETLFQQLKDNYSNNKLNLTGKYNKSLKQAKFYSTLIIHNLLTKG